MNKHASALMDSKDEELFPVLNQFDIPASLLKYDVVVSDEEIRNLGESIFLRWLHYQLKNRTVPVRKSAVPLACEKPETMVEYSAGRMVETTFFPETPDPSDYRRGENDMDYLVAEHTAKVQTLIAKKECGACPLAESCLAVSIVQSPADGVFGVWGGYTEGTRRLILNRFNKLRRAYSSTKTNDMSPEDRESYEQKAVVLKFNV